MGKRCAGGGGDIGLQGVTELVDAERCDDEWLREVQEEMRHGRLSEDTHAFLHGLPTKMPGSWVEGDVACRNASCRALAAEASKRCRGGKTESSDYIALKECSKCRAVRQERACVALCAGDSRFLAPAFIDCPAVFANNDIKYETNKLRARVYATKQNEAITYCAAKDTVTPEALRERPDLPAQKLTWLQRHDRESGDLY